MESIIYYYCLWSQLSTTTVCGVNFLLLLFVGSIIYYYCLWDKLSTTTVCGVNYILPMFVGSIIYYQCLWGQLSTTSVMLPKKNNGQLPIVVDPSQLRTMASEAEDTMAGLYPNPLQDSTLCVSTSCNVQRLSTNATVHDRNLTKSAFIQQNKKPMFCICT